FTATSPTPAYPSITIGFLASNIPKFFAVVKGDVSVIFLLY
ncbi:MAG: hypothetical protein K0R55_2246, partial [Sporomusa sp.]|nr:hypothetical protein [Sporomusa sp.]